MRRFELHRIEDVSGVSGTGVVAQGVEFDDGVIALRWLTEWPTSVVFHDRGAEAVEHVHGHNGRTEVVWIDEDAQTQREARFLGALNAGWQLGADGNLRLPTGAP